MMVRLICSAGVLGALFAAHAGIAAKSDPLAFPRYLQRVTAEFASPADAAAAELAPTPLPGGAARAFSTRWDDTTSAHLAKADMLERVGVKGGFYFVGNAGGDFFATGARALAARGHAVGNHTLDHPFMLQLSANAAFRQILENRIRIESTIDRSVVSYVSPFGWYGPKVMDEPYRSKLVKMLVETGHWVSDDNPLPGAGVPEDVWYPANRFSADDRNPQWEKFEQGLKEQMKRADGDPLAPRIVLGTHSWCDAAGLARQEKWLRENCVRPDWIQLNDCEYGAYRYSFLNGTVRKVSVEGVRAVFSVTRFDPAALGHAIPLSLAFTKEPVRVTCGRRPLARGARSTWTLPHDDGRATVRAIARATAAGTSPRLPGVVFTATPDPAREVLRVVLKNGTSEALTGLYLVAHLPPACLTRRKTLQIDAVAPGKTFAQEIPFGARDRGVFDVDAPFFAASVDFTRAGGRDRFWFCAELPAPKTVLLPRDVACWTAPAACTSLADERLAAISASRGPLPTADGLAWQTGSFRNAAWYNASVKSKQYAKDVKERAKDGTLAEAVAYQFTAPAAGEVRIRTNLAFSKGAVLFLNGAKVPVTGTAFTLPAAPGLNRLVARVPVAKNARYAHPVQIAVCTRDLGSPLPGVPFPQPVTP